MRILDLIDLNVDRVVNEEKIMSDSNWVFWGGLLGLIALLALVQKPAPTAVVRPPPEEVQRRIWEQIQAPIAPTPIPTIPTNQCDSTRFAYPDFTGTPRVGQGCVDDLDCQNHPPVGFPYYQQCCTQDGTCFT